MEEKKRVFISTAIPYVNAKPHIGFALELVQADTYARFKRSEGADVFFLTGTDENSLKNVQAAEEAGKETSVFVEKNAKFFEKLVQDLSISNDDFIRTSVEERHKRGAEKLWKACQHDIYKKKYKGFYCVGCEEFKTEKDLNEKGRCPEHPNKDIEIVEEENYFFKLSNYQEKLKEAIETGKIQIIPEKRKNEMLSFIKTGLEDFSISRSKERAKGWGISVPKDENQVMYVWFDALVNYISCLGWPDDLKKMKQYWPGLQVCGKDNLRQQAAMWPAMLMSAGLTPADQVLIFGFLTINNQKISKSLGNTVDPKVLVNQYGIDAVRYYLISEIPTFYDGDYSEEKFLLKYNADLANGLGNLVARVSNLLEKNQIELKLKEGSDKKLRKDFMAIMDQYDLSAALSFLWQKIRENDEYLSQNKPWKLEDKTKIKKILAASAQNILNLAILISIFLPQTGEEIRKQFLEKQIRKKDSLFPRIEIK